MVFASDTADLAELAGVAGLRWTIEAGFQQAKGEVDLAHCQARSWHGWHRHVTLAMLALAYLAALRAEQHRLAFGKANRTNPKPATA